jgi:serine protease Do
MLAMKRRCLPALLLMLSAPLSCATSLAATAPAEALTPEALFAQLAPGIVFVSVQRADGEDVGSGVILHGDGLIATAAHVVEGATTISVQFLDGSKQGAQIATLSRTEDLALLKVAALPKSSYVATLGDSDRLVVGQTVFCIGAPLGLRHSMTRGIISAIRENYGSELSLMPRNVIQTDASINQGSSGGALFNDRGEVVGIASFIASKSGGSVGLGFAVPSNTVRRRLFEEAIPYFGLVLRRIPAALADVLQWAYPESLLVEKVEPASAGARAGLRGGYIPTDFAGLKILLGGDLIVKVNGAGFDEPHRIHAMLRGLKAGDKVDYTILRGGKLEHAELVVGPTIDIPVP